jgi:hypothetical protein
LDDRFFRAISNATQLATNARLLLSRERYAGRVLSEPLEDLTALEAEIDFLEEFADSIDSEMGPDTSEDDRQLFEAEVSSLEDLIFANSARRTALTLKREQVRQYSLLKPLLTARVKPGSLLDGPSEDRDRDPVVVNRAHAAEFPVKFAKIEATMVAVAQRASAYSQTRMDEEESHGQKLHAAQDRIPEIAEAEKLTFLESELSAIVRSMRVDLLDLGEQREELEAGRAAAEAKAAISPTAVYEKKRADFEARIEKARRRAEDIPVKKAALEALTQAHAKKLREVEQMFSEMAKKAAQARSVEDLAARMAEELYGQKQVVDPHQASLSKVEMLKKNLALMHLDELRGEIEEEEEEEPE